jgi:DNA polymerase-1
MGYGAGEKKLQQILTINGYPLPISEVSWQFEKLQELYSTFFSFREAVIRRAKRDGYVKTLAGQHRRLAAQFKSTTWKARGYGERQAVNAVIQGSAGDIVRRVMMHFDEHMTELRLLAQVHDELVWEFDEGYAMDEDQLGLIAQQAQTKHGFELSVPLVFEPHVGANWLDAKEGSTFVLPEDFASPFEDEDAEVEEDA